MQSSSEEVENEIYNKDEIASHISTHQGKVSINLSSSNSTCVSLKPYFNLKNVTYLYLADNKLSELDEEIFKYFHGLEWLDARNNEIVSIPCTIENHPCLNTILLQNNKIRIVPKVLGSIPELKGLQLSGNPLEYPPANIVNEGQNSILKFLQKEWKEQMKLKDQPIITTNVTKITENKIKKDVTKVDTEPGDDGSVKLDLSDNIFAKKLNEILVNTEAQLQKVKDKEVLRQWRERYLSNSSVALKDLHQIGIPPFGMDECHNKILSRGDLSKPIMFKDPPTKYPKVSRNIDKELCDLLDELNKVSSDKKTSDLLASTLDDINKLKVMQEKLRNLRLKV